MFLGYQKDKIVMVASTQEALERMPCISFDNIKETKETYVLHQGEYITQAQAIAKQAEAEKKAQKDALYAELDKLDLKAIRAMRAIQSGQGTQDDTDKLTELETQAEIIRKQISQLGEGGK